MRTKITCWAAIVAIVAFVAAASWTWAAEKQPVKEPAKEPAKEMVDFINPMIGAGTGGGINGKTFPGAATPFGLVQLSPDTITGGDNGSGYSYTHQTIEGFSFTHMSGVGWYGDLGNFLVMPTTGPLNTERGTKGSEDGYRSRIRHDDRDRPGRLLRRDPGRLQGPRRGHRRPAERHPPLHLPQVRPIADPDRPGPAGRRHVHPAVSQGGR